MPIFSRRRIQDMLNDLRPLLGEGGKTKDLLARLEGKKPEQVLGAEMELALLWGVKQVTDIEIEPTLPDNTRVPEAYTEGLFNVPSYIEITTLSDADLSGEKEMQRAAQIITSFSNTIKKRAGNFMYYTFQEISSWKEGRFTRQRCVTNDFDLDDAQKSQLRAWIPSCKEPDRLYLQNDKIAVTIEIKSHRQKEGFNFWCSLPPLAYDITDNPLYKRLKDKRSQLSGVPKGCYKVIFLADGGSQLLRKLTDKDPLNLYKSGQEIINKFMEDASVDLIFVFSPKRDSSSIYPAFSNLNWQVSCFSKDNKEISLEKLNEGLALIPTPRFEGYQARSLQKQQSFAPSARGWHLGNKITTREDKIIMKISARALQEFLAGTMSKDEFNQFISSDENNLFQLWLMKGYIISDISFESAGTDEDDDYAVFTFDKSPSVSPLE